MMRSAARNGSPLNSPPLTTEKTVVASPIPRPSVSTATSDSVGYLSRSRTPERTSLTSEFIVCSAGNAAAYSPRDQDGCTDLTRMKREGSDNLTIHVECAGLGQFVEDEIECPGLAEVARVMDKVGGAKVLDARCGDLHVGYVGHRIGIDDEIIGPGKNEIAARVEQCVFAEPPPEAPARILSLEVRSDDEIFRRPGEFDCTQ